MLSPSPRLPRSFAHGAMFAIFLVFGCDRAPSADGAREWTPADHDHADEKGKVLSGGSSGARGAKGTGGNDTGALVELTWQNQCALCHGATGRGDGPNGPMVKAPDLTRTDWQAKVSDQEIADVIATGKGQMPKFDLAPEVVSGLVVRIRASKGR